MHQGFPIFNTVESAVRETGANASVIFVPPAVAADAVMEAADAGIALIVCITEGIPTLDMMRALRFIERRDSRLVGPPGRSSDPSHPPSARPSRSDPLESVSTRSPSHP